MMPLFVVVVSPSLCGGCCPLLRMLPHVEDVAPKEKMSPGGWHPLWRMVPPIDDCSPVEDFSPVQDLFCVLTLSCSLMCCLSRQV